MDCEDLREALSARLDGEAPGVDEAVLDHHLTTCSPCATWAGQLEGLHRLVRVRAADPVPDLTAAILARAPETAAPSRTAAFQRPAPRPVSTVRWALFVVALTQLVLASPELVLGGDGTTAVHAARELGAFDVALAVGLLVAAWQPARAWGLLPLAGALVAVLAVTAVADVVDGSATALGETVHLLEAAGLALLWLVAREARGTAEGRVGNPGWSTA